MKKIILYFLLVLVSVTVYARKSYITIYYSRGDGIVVASPEQIIMTGDVPNNIEGFKYNAEKHYWYNNSNSGYGTINPYSSGEILNLLSEYGYEVEFTNENKYFLLSKEIPSGQTLSEGDVNKDGEVNIADVNRLVNLILGIVRDNPSILEQAK